MSRSILESVLSQYARESREGIPEQLKQKIKLEASWELASKLTEPVPIHDDPQVLGEVVEAWLVILGHVARKHGLRVQLSFSRLREKPKPAEAEPAESAEEPAEAEPAEAEEPAEEPAEAEPAEAEEPAE